jgi:hypothetical protein
MTLTAEQYLAFVPTIIAFQEAQALKIFGYSAPLSANQLLALSRSSTYRAARKAFIAQCAVITDKDADELTFIGKHMDVWSRIGHLPRLRPLRTPKSIASAIRDELRGKKAVVTSQKGELDQAQATACAALKVLKTSPKRVVEATWEALKDEPGFMHEVATRLLSEIWHMTDDSLSERNQDSWAMPKGAFLKVMTTAELFKLPAGATLDDMRRSSRNAAENALAAKQIARERGNAAAAKARREAKRAH